MKLLQKLLAILLCALMCVALPIFAADGAESQYMPEIEDPDAPADSDLLKEFIGSYFGSQGSLKLQNRHEMTLAQIFDELANIMGLQSSMYKNSYEALVDVGCLSRDQTLDLNSIITAADLETLFTGTFGVIDSSGVLTGARLTGHITINSKIVSLKNCIILGSLTIAGADSITIKDCRISGSLIIVPKDKNTEVNIDNSKVATSLIISDTVTATFKDSNVVGDVIVNSVKIEKNDTVLDNVKKPFVAEPFLTSLNQLEVSNTKMLADMFESAKNTYDGTNFDELYSGIMATVYSAEQACDEAVSGILAQMVIAGAPASLVESASKYYSNTKDTVRQQYLVYLDRIISD